MHFIACPDELRSDPGVTENDASLYAQAHRLPRSGCIAAGEGTRGPDIVRRKGEAGAGGQCPRYPKFVVARRAGTVRRG